MTNEIRVSRSSIGKAEIDAVTRVLEGGFLGMGNEVNKFESDLSAFFGRDVVCVVNGTAALHLALQAIGLSESDEVLVQSLTYVASFQAISAAGAIPVACDIDPITMGIDLNDAERRLTSRTRAIMPVHYAGGVGDLESIYKFAKIHKLRVIEDAAHAFGSLYKGQRVGAVGDISCFSFDGIKNITSGEGGCIVSDDKKIIEKIKDSRLLGVENDTEKRFLGQRSWAFDVSEQGWRYHMSDIMAAIGIIQLKRFPLFIESRQRLAKLYVSKLAYVDNVEVLPNDFDIVVPHIFPVIFAEEVDRDLVRKQLLSHGIQTGLHYQPNHMLSFFSDSTQTSLPVTENIYTRILTLPLHAEISEDDVFFICGILTKTLDEQRNNSEK